MGRVGSEKERKGLNIEGRGGEKMPLVFHQGGKNSPPNQKDFALRQQYCRRHVMMTGHKQLVQTEHLCIKQLSQGAGPVHHDNNALPRWEVSFELRYSCEGKQT